MTKERNRFVDIMRGVAMLLVVLFHTMTGSTVNSEQSFLFNIVWSLQIPLFILISGYVTRYSKDITDVKSLFEFLGKRTVSYLLPFAVWSFAVRGLILGQKNFFNIKYMLWHMDAGYWFLITVWTISVIFGISSLVSSLVKSSAIGKQALLLAAYICGMALLGGIGYFAGMTFFCIKLTLYYMPFYFAGYLYGQYRDKIFALSFGKRAIDIIIAVCFAAWLVILTRFNLFEVSDGGIGLIIRAAASICGCIAVCGLLKGVFNKTDEALPNKFLLFVGTESLAVYLIHGLLINIFKAETPPAFSSISGFALVFANYVLSVFLCVIIIYILGKNKTLCRLLGIKGKA